MGCCTCYCWDEDLACSFLCNKHYRLPWVQCDIFVRATYRQQAASAQYI